MTPWLLSFGAPLRLAGAPYTSPRTRHVPGLPVATRTITETVTHGGQQFIQHPEPLLRHERERRLNVLRVQRHDFFGETPPLARQHDAHQPSVALALFPANDAVSLETIDDPCEVPGGYEQQTTQLAEGEPVVRSPPELSEHVELRQRQAPPLDRTPRFAHEQIPAARQSQVHAQRELRVLGNVCEWGGGGCRH